MGYLAIYRKYRPTNFDEVSGQKVVVDILKNAIKNDKLAHAYLFAGPRGTGKTSIAKILARTINCECDNTTNPCEQCKSCINSKSKECVDIIEIDAASNNGVDEIRELKSKINIVPSFLKYKIYIIDEVHMLSIGAFNALLKTLEEPPSHVIFILATTELQKIPTTILSRCQILEFKKISPKDMKDKISYICKTENIKIEDNAIDEIIDYSDGCMRDALSLLEKANSYTENVISASDVRNICGKTSKEELQTIIDLIRNGEKENLINKINELYLSDYDLIYVVEDIIKELEQKIFDNNNSQNEIYQLITLFVKLYDKMKTTSVNKKIILEVELINYLNENNKNISREIFLKQKFDNIEKEETQILNKNNDDDKIVEKKVSKEIVNTFDNDNFKKIRINNTFVSASKEILNNIKNKWNDLKNNAFDKNNGAMICNLLDGIPVAASTDYLLISFPYSSMSDNINEDYANFQEILNQYLQISTKIVAISNEEWNKYKSEYIKNLGNNIKYELIEDEYIKKENSNKQETIMPEKNDNSDNIENKVLELFDSEFVKIE